MTADIRVLHVGGEPDSSSLTADFFKRDDYQITVETTTSGNEALELLSTHEIDCVVSDYDMPEMDGIELLKAIRERWPTLPVILFTDEGSEEIASQAIAAGVTDYLRKDGTEAYESLSHRIVRAVEEYRIQHFEHRATHSPIDLVDRISDGFMALNEDFEFTYLNEQAAEIFGKPATELLGTNIWEQFPEGKATPFFDHYQETMETGEPRVLEEYFEPWGRWYHEQI